MKFSKALFKLLRKSIRGEWWIDDSGQAQYADGDIGDQNHEMIAFSSGLQMDEETIVDFGSYGVEVNANGIDFAGVGKIALVQKYRYPGDINAIDEWESDLNSEIIIFIKENVDSNITNDISDFLYELGYNYLIEQGANKQFLDWYRSKGNYTNRDFREYAMLYMNWIRVQGDHFQFNELDERTLKNIGNFVYEQVEEGGENPEESEDTLYLEQLSDKSYWEIPVNIIIKSDATPVYIKYYGSKHLAKKVK